MKKDKSVASESGAACLQCGQSYLHDARFCERCGAQLKPSSAMVGKDTSMTSDSKVTASGNLDEEPGDSTLTWECGLPLLTDRFMLWDFLRVILLSLVLMQGILLLTGWLIDGELLILPVEVWAITGGIFVALLIVVTLAVYQNRFHARFTVDAKGVTFESGRRESKINRIVLVLALLSGRPGTAGAALLGYSSESSFFSWRDIHKIKIHSAERVISLSNSWRTLLRLHCPPEIFDDAVAQVQAHADKATRLRDTHARPRHNHPAVHYVVWVFVTVCATFGTGAWFWVGEDANRFSLLAGVLVLLAGLLPGLVGWLIALPSLGLALLFLGHLVAEALSRSSTLSQGITYGYEYDTPLLALALLSTIVLCAMALRRLRERER